MKSSGEEGLQLYVVVGFFSGKSYWGPLQSRSLGTIVTPLCD